MYRFPVQVTSAINDLVSPPMDLVRGRDPQARIRLRVLKLSKLRFLEDYFISRMVARATVFLILEKRLPFCLFLRSFTMGHRAHDFVTVGGWLDVSEPPGGRLLRLLSETLGSRTSLVAIASPDEWLPNRLVPGPFANIVVDSGDWQKVVDVLIAAAQLIVVHRAGRSVGLDYELASIRAAGRESSTIVVREPQLSAEAESATAMEIRAYAEFTRTT
jgi:hypothetical protein